MKLFIGSVGFAVGAALATAAYTPQALEDEIASLPGWNGDLPSKQFSGYLNVSATKHIHYWFERLP